MKKNKKIQKNNLPIVFEQKEVRRVWYNEEWYFAIVDIIAILSESTNPQVYWRVLKKRLIDEGSNETVTKCNAFKMLTKDNKMRFIDTGNLKTVFRIIQSIPSPKAEPFKQWLAKVGQERIDEMMNPEIALNRSREYWKKHGRSKKWIEQRMTGQETRNKLTDYWKSAGVKEGDQYAILTNIIHEEWSDLAVQDHKKLKGLGKQNNLRDHMSEAELIFTALAELSTRQIAENMEAFGFEKNKIPAKKGGKIAKNARIALEEKTGKSVVTGENYLPKNKNKNKNKFKL